MMNKNHQIKVEISTLNKAAKANEAPLWSRLAKELARPTRNVRKVNVSKLVKFSDDNILVVPGKVLGTGIVDKAIKVAAFSFSDAAKDKIKMAKGTVMTIQELLKSNPKAKKVKIIG